jgi:hypothetical protein
MNKFDMGPYRDIRTSFLAAIQIHNQIARCSLLESIVAIERSEPVMNSPLEAQAVRQLFCYY